jgi:hypothetical protein
MTSTTDTTGRFVAACDGCTVRIEHRDGDDSVLVDTLLLSEPIRDERELGDILSRYLDGPQTL